MVWRIHSGSKVLTSVPAVTFCIHKASCSPGSQRLTQAPLFSPKCVCSLVHSLENSSFSRPSLAVSLPGFPYYKVLAGLLVHHLSQPVLQPQARPSMMFVTEITIVFHNISGHGIFHTLLQIKLPSAATASPPGRSHPPR